MEGYIKINVHINVQPLPPFISCRTYVVPNKENISKDIKTNKNWIPLKALKMQTESKTTRKH